MGADCRTITEVLDWIATTHPNTRPKKAELGLKNISDQNSTKSNDKKIIATNDQRRDGEHSNNLQNKTDNFKPTSSSSNIKTPPVNHEKNKRKRKYDEGVDKNALVTNDRKCSKNVTNDSSAIAETDILEGRKLAMLKLQEKLKQMKAARLGKRTAMQYEEERKMKRRLSKLKMKERKKKVDGAASKIGENNKMEAPPDKRVKYEDTSAKRPTDDENKLRFSKFNFIVRDEKPKKMSKKEKRDKFTGKDYKRLLQKAEKREERLDVVRSKNPEKAALIESNIQWKKALSRIEGQKVKDDPEKLKRSLKKKEKIKEWRKKKWLKRTEQIKLTQDKKQERRAANIQARKDAVKKKKLQKARKKGRIL